MASYPEELLLRIRAQIEGKENLTGFTTQLGEVTQQVNGLDSAINRLLNPRTPLRLMLDEAPLRGQIERLKAQLAGMTIKVNFAGGNTSDVRRLTTAVTELSGQLGGLVDKQRIVIREIERVDSGTRKAATGINNLVAGYQRGAVEGGKFTQQSEILGKVMLKVAQDEGIFSRETAVAEAALKKLNTVNLSQLRMNAQRELAAVTQAVREANTVRLDWQNGKVSDSATLERISQMRRGYEQTQQAILGQKEALQGLGVLDEQQTKRVQVLTQQYERYGQALRTLGSIEASINGTIQKGSLADSMSRGITASAQQATEALRLLQAQEQAGIITKRELASALNAEVTSLRGSILATQQQAAGLRNLGVLDAQQTAELNALTRAELSYTEALARTTAAQQAAARSSSVMRQGMSLAGGRGGGLNNAMMAASFVSPELGMVGMAASMGPAVAGVASVALAVKGVVDLTVKGQDEAKKWQQAFLVMSANGVKNLDQVAASINDITVNGTQAEKMFSRASLAQAMAELARGGVKGAEALKTLAVSAELAAAEHVPLNEATERLYSNLQHLDMGGDQAAGFGDKLARASHMSLASMDALSKGMNVVGQTAHTMGFSTEETLAMLVMLAKKGMDPATIGATGLRNALQMSIKPSKEAQAVYAALGIQMRDSTGHMRSGRDIVMDFQKVMSATGPIYNQVTGQLINQNDLAAMSFKVYGTRSATAMLGLRGNLQELTDEVRDSDGFLTKYANTTVSGLEGSQKRLDAATKNLSLSFAKTFTPALASAAELMTKFVNSIDPAVQKLSKFMDLFNSAKSPKDLEMKLKITAADSDSDKVMKFIAGTLVGTGKVTKAIGGAWNPFQIADGYKATDLQKALISRGLIQEKGTLDETLNQHDYIAKHLPEFQAMLDKSLAKQKIDVPGLKIAGLPNVQGPQVFGGAGPLLPNQIRPDEAARRQGNITADLFIKSMTSSVVGDPRIPAWCADVVSQMLKRLGYAVKSDVNARRLEQNVKAAGGRVIPLSQARQGDVVFYHGIDPYTGHPYGASSGTHVEMGAGWKNGVYQLVGSNTSAHMTGKAIYDTRQATIYRLPGGDLFADTGPAQDKEPAENTTASRRPDLNNNDRLKEQLQQAHHLIAQVAAAAVAENEAWLSKAEQAVKEFKKSNPGVWNSELQKQYSAAQKGATSLAGASDLKELLAQLTHLKAQYDAGKIGLKQYHAAADKVRTQALAIQGTLKEGSKEWSAADRLIIAATSATKVHTRAAQDATLTYAQWNKNRAEATRLAKLESDLSDGKLGDKASIQAKSTLANYRKDPVQATALEEAERRLRLQQQRQEEAQRQAEQNAKERRRQAEQDAKDRTATEEAVTRQMLGFNQQQRQDAIATEQSKLDSLKRGQQNRLDAAKDDAAQRLQVAKTTASQIQAQENRVAAAQLVDAKAKAQEGYQSALDAIPEGASKGQRTSLTNQAQQARTRAVSAAYRDYYAAVGEAADHAAATVNEAQGKVDDALDKQSQKIRDLRDKYSSLADDLRQKIDDGSISQKDIENVTRKLADLDKESQEAHLSSNRFLQAAHTGVQAVLETAKGSAQALQENKSAEELLKSRADAVQDVLDTTEKLFNTGDSLEEQAQSRSNALGQLAQGLSTLAGVSLSPETLGGFRSLSDLYDHLTKSGADLEHMNLTGLEQLFQTFQGMSSRNADFLPLDQAKALYDELIKVGLASKDATDLLDGSKYSAEQRSTVLEGYGALQGGDQGKLNALQQRLLNDKGLKDSPLMRGLLDQIDVALNKLTEGVQQRVIAAQDKLAQLQAQQPMTDLEARKGFLSPADYQQQHEALATKIENDSWSRQQSDMSMDGALPAEIEVARQEHEARLTAITRQGVQERFDLEQQAAQRSLAAQRAAEDAVSRLAQTELERQHNLGLVSEADYLQKRYTLQVQAAQQANTRALQDATKVVLDPTTGEQKTTVDLVAVRQANAALTQATTEATNERDAAVAALTLRNKRALEDALTAQETAALENLHNKGLLSDAEYQRQQEEAEQLAAQRRHDRAVEDAHGDAEAISADNVQLQTDLTTIAAKGVSDREALVASERQFRIDQAKREIEQSGGWSGHADYRTALEAERQFWVQKITEAEKGSEAWRKAVQGQQQAADTILQDRGSQVDQYASIAKEGLSMVVDAWDAVSSNQDEVDDGMRRIGFQSKDLAKAWGEDMARMVDDVATLTKSIMQGLATGNWTGAIVGGLKMVWNWFTRNSKAAAQAKADWKNYADQFKLIDPSSFAHQTKTTTGALFWKTDHYTIEINKMAEQVALALEKGITEGSQAGLKNAIQTGNLDDFEAQIKEATYNALLDAMIAAFLQSDAVKKTLGKAMTDYANNPNDPAAKANLNKAISDYKVLAKGFIDTTRVGLADLAPTAGELLASKLSAALQQGIADGSKNGLKDALQTGDMSGFTAQIKEATYNALMDAMISAFLESEVVKNTLGKAISDYASHPEDPQAKAQLAKAVQDYKSLAAGFVETTRAQLADMAPTAGELLAASLRGAIASGVENGAKSGILKAVQSGFSNDLAQDIRTAVGSSLMDTLIDTFLKSAQMKAIIEPSMNELVSAMSDADPSNDDAAFAKFDRQLGFYTEKAGAFADQLRARMGQAGLASPGATNGNVTNQYTEADAALQQHLQSGDPAEQQRALEAYRQLVGGGAVSSAYTIGSGGTLSGGTDFGSVVSALQTWSQTAAQIAQAGRDHIQAAQLQIQAANLNLQAAGQRVIQSVEYPRQSFNNGGI